MKDTPVREAFPNVAAFGDQEDAENTYSSRERFPNAVLDSIARTPGVEKVSVLGAYTIAICRAPLYSWQEIDAMLASPLSVWGEGKLRHET